MLKDAWRDYVKLWKDSVAWTKKYWIIFLVLNGIFYAAGYGIGSLIWKPKKRKLIVKK